MNLTKGVKIVSIDGKDIVKYKSDFNNTFRDDKDNICENLKRYRANLDYSLALIKLNELLGENLCNVVEDDKLYSDAIIIVTFKYSLEQKEELLKDKDYKSKLDEFNNLRAKRKELKKNKNSLKNRLVTVTTNEKNYNQDIEELNNFLNMESDNKKLRVIKSKITRRNNNHQKYNEESKELLNGIENTEIEIGLKQLRIKELKEELKIIKQKYFKSTQAIRDELYESGFRFNGNLYKRFVRSSGSARIGKCLFARADIYEEMMDFVYDGIDWRNVKDFISLPAEEAYISLTATSLIGTIDVSKENILIMDTYISEFEDTSMATELLDGELKTKEKKVWVENDIWDGQSLIEKEAMGDFQEFGAIQLRNSFFKGMAFNTNIQQFFSNNGIKEISQLNGFTLATDISQIKLITNKNSIKYMKFGEKEEWLERLNNTWGVAKTDHKTKFMNGTMVQSHYQLLQTLQLSEEEISQLLKPTIDYYNLLKNDIEVLKWHIGCNINVSERLEEKEVEENGVTDNKEFEVKKDTTNDYMYTMLQINKDFQGTQIFKNFKREVLKSFKNNIRRGHILINGNYEIVICNGLEMLMESCNKWTSKQPILRKDEVHTLRFGKNQNLVGVRSPHCTMGNLLYCKNVECKAIDTYFNNTKEIVHISAIGENIMERLSSLDTDGDSILLTDEKLICDKVEQNYEKFLVPFNNIRNKNDLPYTRSELDKSKLDIATAKSSSAIGDIINTSQILNSVYWDKVSKGEDIEGLYELISQLDVMSCICIDSAKKPSPVELDVELEKIKQTKWYPKERPYFFKYVAKKRTKKVKNENGETVTKVVKPKYEYKAFSCSMDYLEKEVDKISIADDVDKITLLDLLTKKAVKELKTGKANNRHFHEIIDRVKELDKDNRGIWSNKEIETKDKFRLTEENKKSLINELKKLELIPETIVALIKRLNKDFVRSKKDNDGQTVKTDSLTQLGRLILVTLFNLNTEEFLKLFRESEIEQLKKAKRDDENTIKIYNQYFKKEIINL